MYKNELPSFLDNTNFRFLNIDDKYVSSIIIIDYPKQISFFDIIESIPKNVNYDMSFFIDKKDTSSVLKQLTYYISSSGTEIKTVNENQMDIDVLSKIKEDAKNLRKEIQINNEQVYFLNIFITFYHKDSKELFIILKDFQSKLYSRQIVSNISNFRNLDFYLLSLPFFSFNQNVLKDSYRNLTTSALANIFPFYKKTIFDEKGIIFGYTKSENKIFSIDIFDEKYLNSNMCIFGSSGSGKSYFTKLMIIRNYLMNKNQYIFDPEGEYSDIVKTLGGQVIDFNEKNNNCYFNILEITEYEIYMYNESFFVKKIEKVTKFIIKMCDILEEELYEKIKESLIKLYKEFGINENIESIYIKENDNKIFVDKKVKTSSFFPNLTDFNEKLKDKKLSNLIKKNILSKYEFLSKNSTFKINQSLINFNTNNIKIKDAIILMEYFLEELLIVIDYNNLSNYNNLKNLNSKKTIIYIDEIWKYICIKESNNLAETIFMLFKTIRKKGGSIITITQDISDFFSYENGSFGKSILNNSGFKVFFKLDFSDLEILQKLSLINKENLDNILRLDKGQAFIGFKSNNIILNIKANEYEDELIKKGGYNEDFNSFR